MTETAIVCRGVSRNFGARPAVRELDLEIATGTVFGLLGPNGSGKTTTVRLLLGLLRPHGGTLRVCGLDPVPDGERVRARTGVLFDQPGLYERLTAWQNLELAGRIARLDPAERRRRVEAGLRRVDLWDRRAERVSGFSKGMRQKLGIARALLAEPDLLILDEPTSGLDPVNIKMLRDLLLGLAQEGRRTILLCTHHLDEAQRICDRVGILRSGRLVAVGTPEGLGRDGAVHSVRLHGRRLDVAMGLRPDLPQGAQLSLLETDPPSLRLECAGPEEVERVVAALVASGAGLQAVVPERRSLEDTYLAIVGGDAG